MELASNNLPGVERFPNDGKCFWWKHRSNLENEKKQKRLINEIPNGKLQIQL